MSSCERVVSETGQQLDAARNRNASPPVWACHPRIAFCYFLFIFFLNEVEWLTFPLTFDTLTRCAVELYRCQLA